MEDENKPRSISGALKIARFAVPLVTAALVFIVQPVFRTLYHPETCGIICFPPVQNILVGFLILVGLPLSIWFLIPDFSKKTYQILKVIFVVGTFSVLLPLTSTIGEYPYSIYRNYTRPTITVLAPSQGETLETGKSYEVRWKTANINPNELIQVLVSYNLSGGAGWSVDTLGPTANTGSFNITLDPKVVKSGPVSVILTYPADMPWGGVPEDIHQNPRGALTQIALRAENPETSQLIIQNNNDQLRSKLLAFKRAALEEANKTNSYEAVCASKLINTNTVGMKSIADDIVRMKVGATDQVSAGINCISNNVSYGVQVPLNQVGTNAVSTICISDTKFPDEKPFLYYPQRSEITTGTVVKVIKNIAYADRTVYECK